MPTCLSLALGHVHQAGAQGSLGTCGHPASSLWVPGQHMQGAPISAFPQAHVLLHYTALYPQAGGMLSAAKGPVSHTHPPPTVCAHIPGAEQGEHRSGAGPSQLVTLGTSLRSSLCFLNGPSLRVS